VLTKNLIKMKKILSTVAALVCIAIATEAQIAIDQVTITNNASNQII
jgi:hypothetical protein